MQISHEQKTKTLTHIFCLVEPRSKTRPQFQLFHYITDNSDVTLATGKAQLSELFAFLNLLITCEIVDVIAFNLNKQSVCKAGYFLKKYNVQLR